MPEPFAIAFSTSAARQQSAGLLDDEEEARLL